MIWSLRRCSVGRSGKKSLIQGDTLKAGQLGVSLYVNVCAEIPNMMLGRETGTTEDMTRRRLHGVLIISAALLPACDPLLTIQGSFWPPWIVSMMMGLAFTVLVSWLLAWLKLAAHVGPPLLIYPCLWAWMTFTSWLVGYGY